jgi:hypothetical protein
LDKPKNTATKKKEDSDDEIDYNTYNLNKLSDWELKKVKQKMD